MASDLSPEPLLDLHNAVRRAVAEVDTCAALGRAQADRVRSRWRGGRRADFEAASAELDAATRRALDDLRGLGKVTTMLTAGDR